MADHRAQRHDSRVSKSYDLPRTHIFLQSCYIAAYVTMVLHTTQQWQRLDKDQTWISYQTTHIPPSSRIFNSSPLYKMANTFAEDIFKHIFLNENDRISIIILLKFVPRGSNDYKSVFVQVMVWHWTSDKPLPEQMLTQFTDAYMRH